MEIDLEAIETKTFRRSWRGYNGREVRAYLRQVASLVRDDDHFRRAGVEVASALRRMHELVTTTHDEAVQAASSLRRDAVVEAEGLLAEVRATIEQMTAEAEAEAGRVRFEAAVWATDVRAEAETERAEALASAEEARAAIVTLEDELTERARDTVAEEFKKRRQRIERLDGRIHDLTAHEAELVSRLHEIENDIGRLVRGPMAEVIFVDVPGATADADDSPGDPTRTSDEATEDDSGVVLDLTESRLDAAMRAGFHRALNGTDD